MIAIIDYGMGNLGSVHKALSLLKYESIITGDPAEVAKADRVILPGVGAFGAAMANLQDTGLDQVVKDAVSSGKPFLGICLGMQLLLSESDELGHWEGLGIVPGKVEKFDFSGRPDAQTLKIPHVGWNRIQIKKKMPLFDGVPDGSMMYFVHSYYCIPEDPDTVAATTDHGIDFCSIIGTGNTYATQFHPEKSGTIGLQILRNFGKL